MIEKSILLVGNSGSILNSNLGNTIDKFDEVIRINEGKTKGWEKDAGLKFNIWSTYNPEKKFTKFLNGYKDRGYSDNQIKEILKDVMEVWYVAPRLDLLHEWNYKLYNLESTIKRHESPLMLREISRNIKEPTTGFILIYLLTHMYDKIYIVGFDFFSHSGVKPEFEHYFSENPIERAEEKENRIRELDKEWIYTRDLIDKKTINVITHDTIIEKSSYIGKELLNKTCKYCNKTSSYYWWENRLCHFCEGLL
jgi:hypothetical protein